jgi:RHS repeat-associated protein
VNPVTTHYLVDPNHAYAQVIEEAEQQGSGTPTLKALYAVGDDRIRRYTPAVAGSGGGPSIPAGLRYYHADGLGSTRLLTDDTAAVTDQLTYEAFGEVDAAASVQTSDNAFLYTGEQFDPNSGFYYLRARYMNPSVGRFIVQDAYIGNGADPTSLHKYMYGNADPVNGRDPSGHVTLVELGQSLQTAGNLTTSALRVANTIHRVETTVNMVYSAIEIAQLFYSGQIDKVMREALRDSTGAYSKVNINDAVESLLRNSQPITTWSLASWVRYLTPRVNNIEGFVIYLPQSPISVTVPFASAGKYKVSLHTDAKGRGRLTGVGIKFRDKKVPQQVWRMDVHGIHADRDDANDAKFIQDRQFHYHVRKPPE